MASPACWKCLSRPGVAQLTSSVSLNAGRTAVAAFSTSTAQQLPAPPKKKTLQQKSMDQRATSTLKIKKKAIPQKTGKPPAPGERKALRKRVVLSNTNALKVEEMVDLSADVAAVNGNVGQVMGIPDKTVDSLRAVGAFKAQQGWNLFKRPGLLVRRESAVVGEKILEAETEKGVLKLMLDGERVTGKGMMLIHAMAVAFLRGWIVINIPEAQDVTNASTDYAPIEGTTPTQYSQNTYTAAWLDQILKGNGAVLNHTNLKLQHNLPIPPEKYKGITLGRLCELGFQDPDIAWPVFQALWAEITAPGRPPVMVALDGLQFAMQDSLYRAADFSLIHSHDLSIIRHFSALLSGAIPMPNGGAVLAATSRSHAPISKSVDIAAVQGWERWNFNIAARATAAQASRKAAKEKAALQEKKRALETFIKEKISQIEGEGLPEKYQEEYHSLVTKGTRDVKVADAVRQLRERNPGFRLTVDQLSLDRKMQRLKKINWIIEINEKQKPKGVKKAAAAPELTPRDPYERGYDARADAALEGIQTLKLGGLSKLEARGLMEYWAKSGVLRAQVDETAVAEKWALSGGGIIGEIERGALRMRI